MRLALLLPLSLLAAPAPAQIWDGGRSAERPQLRPIDPDAFQRGRETRRIDRSIGDGVRRGELTRREARELRAQARAIAGTSFGPASGVGTQQTGAVLNLRGLVDAKRAEGRARRERQGR